MPSTYLNKFRYLGLLLKAEHQNSWLVSHTGASCAKHLGGNNFELIVSGRDTNNRSTLGTVHLHLDGDQFTANIKDEPVLTPGQIGAFDESGVSYPYLVEQNDIDYLFYTGWMLTVLTPFQNQLGLAVRKKGENIFQRVSRAPVMNRNDFDFTSIGSTAVLYHDGLWRMWYTGFGEWTQNEMKIEHTYCIKYAFSENGKDWKRNNDIVIPSTAESMNVARPTVIYDEFHRIYRMWFCYRGTQYKIGYATSKDGIIWIRNDTNSGFSPSGESWDAESQCYPFVIKHQNSLYLIYCGNNYGKGGLGICRQELS